jgi:signal transduction histidine kinase
MVQFSALKMNMSVLPNQHSSLKDDRNFRNLLVQLDNATRELRRTAHNLMPDILYEKGLPEATAYFCRSLNLGDSLNITVLRYGDFPELNHGFGLIVYRMIQELVQNIVKHAAASKALVQLSCNDNLLCITIEDNGKGMGPEAPNSHKGMGLNGIQKRVADLGGNIEFNNHQEGGTLINIEFDIQQFIVNKPAQLCV